MIDRQEHSTFHIASFNNLSGMKHSNRVEFLVTEIGLLRLTFRLAASSETWEETFSKSLTKPQGETFGVKDLFQE